VSDLIRGVLMKEIHEKLRRDRSELSLSPISLSAPIVGRQKELALVMNHYQAAKAGRTEVVLLTGEPGIGKTRLLDEIALLCAQDGAVVLHRNASEAEGMPPFLSFLEALGRYIRATSQDQIRTQVATLPQMLVSLLPELAVYLPDFHIPQSFLPEQSKFRLYEAIGSFLESINTSLPLVIIIDNLQWADSASLDLLCHLTYHQSNAYLFILGAYREGEVARTPAVARTLVELSHQRALTTVIVPPLSITEIGKLVSGRYGGSLSSEVHTLLYAQSEGNPFFAEELLDGWLESGALKLENQEWVTVAPLDSMLPPTIAGALRQRFAQLAPAIIDHLRVAAIIGRSFDPSLLATVEEQEIEAVEECLLEAARAGLVRVDDQGYWLFSHDKIRECLYTEVSTSRRRRLVERARDREQKAFSILFNHYNAKICNYLTRLVHDESTALDLAQNTFCRAWEKLPTINEPSCFKSWLYRIATREAHMHLRCVRQTEPLPFEELEFSLSQHLIVNGPEKQVEETELIKMMLAHLSLQYRTCLVLQIEGFSLQEISELAGMSEKNVSVSISRAREQCRQFFQHVRGELA
jgi:RNA polymerase sigma factor (sigma-70 family)